MLNSDFDPRKAFFQSGGAQSQVKQPADFFLNGPTGGLFDLKGRSPFSGSELSSGIDFSKILGRLADITYGKFEPLEDWAIAMMQDAASGGGALFRQFLSPMFASLNAQVPHAQRRITDTMAPGGQRGEAQTDLEKNNLGAQAQAASQILNWTLGQSLDTGLGATARIYPLLAAGGQIARKPGSAK